MKRRREGRRKGGRREGRKQNEERKKEKKSSWTFPYAEPRFKVYKSRKGSVWRKTSGKVE